MARPRLSSSRTGDFICAFQPHAPDSNLRGGAFADFTIDGSHAGVGSTGIHYGDLTGGRLRGINIRGFTRAGDIGLYSTTCRAGLSSSTLT